LNSTGFSVKYLKEVTPYFRKASLLAELGWDLQKEYMGGEGIEGEEPLPGPPPDMSYSRSDTRCIPLTLALLATNFRHPDAGKKSPYRFRILSFFNPAKICIRN
jgi:hypothetical protein